MNTVTDRGFFFLLSSAQMANPTGIYQFPWQRCVNPCMFAGQLNKFWLFLERRDGWKNSNLQALFVFPESRDVTKYCKCIYDRNSETPCATIQFIYILYSNFYNSVVPFK